MEDNKKRREIKMYRIIILIVSILIGTFICYAYTFFSGFISALVLYIIGSLLIIKDNKKEREEL